MNSNFDNLKNIIYGYTYEICEYSQMQLYAASKDQRDYIQKLIDMKIEGLIEYVIQYISENEYRGMGSEYNTNSYIYEDNSLEEEYELEEENELEEYELDEHNELGEENGLEEDNELEEEYGIDEQNDLDEDNGLNEIGEPVEQIREFTLEELATYNGTNQRAAYVAVNNIVYDVSMAPPWRGGNHFGLTAGRDLTTQFMGCHLGSLQILERYPRVGVLIR